MFVESSLKFMTNSYNIANRVIGSKFNNEKLKNYCIAVGESDIVEHTPPTYILYDIEFDDIRNNEQPLLLDGKRKGTARLYTVFDNRCLFSAFILFLYKSRRNGLTICLYSILSIWCDVMCCDVPSLNYPRSSNFRGAKKALSENCATEKETYKRK